MTLVTELSESEIMRTEMIFITNNYKSTHYHNWPVDLNSDSEQLNRCPFINLRRADVRLHSYSS